MKIIGLLLSLLISARASAHPLDLGLLQVTVDDRKMTFALELAPEAAAQISGIASKEFNATQIDQQRDVLFAATLGASQIQPADAGACHWLDNSQAALKNEKVLLTATSECPTVPTVWSLDLAFLKRAPVNFELLVKIKNEKGVSELVVRAAEPKLEFFPQEEHSWSEFISLGIKHIGAVPSEWQSEKGNLHLPEGIDHILFVVALVLGGGGLIGLLKTVTGFTIGHSFTLALATLGWIHVPSRLVESGIALSIVIVAAESLVLRNGKSRWRIAMAFGLLHGLGFASALADLHLSGISFLRALVGFNVGVEGGQAIIVLVTLPLFLLCQRNKYTKRYLLPLFSVAILLVGSYWFVRRAFAI